MLCFLSILRSFQCKYLMIRGMPNMRKVLLDNGSLNTGSNYV